MKKKVIRLTESDLENLVNRIVKENKELNEIGGYDYEELGREHGQSTMESIRDTFQVISDSIEHLNSLKFDILDDKLSNATKRLLGVVTPALNEFGKVWVDAEKRRLRK